jgi:CheY-like chemotaxis protein
MNKTACTVLILEDEELLLQAVTKKFSLCGFNTISCVSGEQALDYLKNIDIVPDAIWLDYHLKGMDGLDFLRNIKLNKKWKKIPVIVVSNSVSPNKVQNMLALGANEYLLKAEYRLDQIVNIFKKIIQDGVK